MESAQLVLDSLATGYGELVKQAKAPLHSRASKPFKCHSYAASMLPDSILGMANRGFDLLLTPINLEKTSPSILLVIVSCLLKFTAPTLRHL